MTARRGRTLAVVISLTVLLAVVVALAQRGADNAAPPGAAPVAATTGNPASAGGAERAPAAGASDAPLVIVPGRPGEPAAELPAAEVRDDSPPRHNSMDTWFVRMMIPHHEQALEMARLAPDRAADPKVRALADRIRASQRPEIGVLRAWLTARGLSAEVDGHDHGTMRGMQSPEAMRQLAAARGTDFDHRFLRMMTEHHEGAVVMATDLLRVGADLTLSEFANSVAVEQGVEIARMRELVPS
ncbi:DUF305 domain-containing protein [Micromonospora sp. CA-263727]|uniref:DUF305 domain-containing protein n=1 Tax=Micromonospora sp. CA-263727 TaxID=3239967 RepID=UPI003D8EBA4A